jgi:hypothetical protein
MIPISLSNHHTPYLIPMKIGINEAMREHFPKVQTFKATYVREKGNRREETGSCRIGEDVSGCTYRVLWRRPGDSGNGPGC